MCKSKFLTFEIIYFVSPFKIEKASYLRNPFFPVTNFWNMFLFWTWSWYLSDVQEKLLGFSHRKLIPQTTSIFMEQLWGIGIGKYKILWEAERITYRHLFWLVKNREGSRFYRPPKAGLAAPHSNFMPCHRGMRAARRRGYQKPGDLCHQNTFKKCHNIPIRTWLFLHVKRSPPYRTLDGKTLKLDAVLV